MWEKYAINNSFEGTSTPVLESSVASMCWHADDRAREEMTATNNQGRNIHGHGSSWGIHLC